MEKTLEDLCELVGHDWLVLQSGLTRACRTCWKLEVKYNDEWVHPSEHVFLAMTNMSLEKVLNDFIEWATCRK